MKIDESLIKYPKDIFDSSGNLIGVTFVSGDAACVSVSHKKGSNKKEIGACSGLSPEYKYFYTTSKMIL